MYQGKISFIDFIQQCGIIIQENGKSFFFKADESINTAQLYSGKPVTFELAEDQHGTIATNIQPHS